jgi:SpoVK/Ycf46/Vps4 family AAA+-type ATPase
MFKQNIGSTTNDLSESDLQLLASETEGFSGSDISVLVRDALYEPVRIAQIATHFKKVPDPSGQHEFLWEPCSSGDRAAKEMDLYSIGTGLVSGGEKNGKEQLGRPGSLDIDLTVPLHACSRASHCSLLSFPPFLVFLFICTCAPPAETPGHHHPTL